MPSKYKINQTYLNEMVQIVDRLAAYGIYVINDLHQGMMSSKFGSYDGVPLWLLNEMLLSEVSAFNVKVKDVGMQPGKVYQY